MDIAVDERSGGRAVVQVSGRLDLVSAGSLRGAVAETVQSGHGRIVVDLEAVPFVDSSGLAALIAGFREARQAGGELRIASASAPVLTVLKLMRLDRLMRPYATVDEALDGL